LPLHDEIGAKPFPQDHPIELDRYGLLPLDCQPGTKQTRRQHRFVDGFEETGTETLVNPEPAIDRYSRKSLDVLHQALFGHVGGNAKFGWVRTKARRLREAAYPVTIRKGYVSGREIPSCLRDFVRIILLPAAAERCSSLHGLRRGRGAARTTA
jgi:hypothetical protein